MGKKRQKHSYKYVVDNKMRNYGDIDTDKRIIRINKKASRQWSKEHRGAGLLDSIVHEETHRKHPRMGEKAIKRKTKQQVKHMSKRQKAKSYSKL